MFKLFASIFGLQDKQQGADIPDLLIKAAIERALDGTDPRMRILSGYAKALRQPVTHAVKHVIALVDAMPEAVPVSSASREANPALQVVFTSAIRMNEIIGSDHGLRDYQVHAAHPLDTVTGLLVVERNEKRCFGYALVDDKLMNDVQQTVVSFDNHRLVDFAVSEEETRRLVKRRAFDYLLSIALERVSEQRDEREKLSQQRALLRVKLDILKKGGSGFSSDMGTQDRTALQARLEEVESQLHALGPVEEILQNNLAIVVETLGNAEKHLWVEAKPLRLDQHYMLHNDTDNSVPAISFRDACDSNGQRMTLLFLSISLPIVESSAH